MFNKSQTDESFQLFDKYDSLKGKVVYYTGKYYI